MHRQPSSLYEPHMQHNMALNYKGLYEIFYKISMEVVKIFFSFHKERKGKPELKKVA